jgi:hypothetical protein
MKISVNKTEATETVESATLAINSAVKGNSNLTGKLEILTSSPANMSVLSETLVSYVDIERKNVANSYGFKSYEALITSFDLTKTLAVMKDFKGKTHRQILFSLRSMSVGKKTQLPELMLIKAMLAKPMFNFSFKFNKTTQTFSFDKKNKRTMPDVSGISDEALLK